MNEQGHPSLPICDHIIRDHKLCLALNDIMMPINFSHDVDEIFHTVVDKSCKALGCESARIAMREGDNWVIRYVRNSPYELIGRSFTDEELPHAALAMTTRKPVAIDDAFNDDRTNAGMMESLGIKSVLVLPLMEKDVVTGTLMFGYHAGAVSFSDAEIDYAKRMTTGIAIAIQNARLYQDLEESKKLGDALNEIDAVLYSTQDYDAITNKMLQLATDAIGAESAVIFSKEGERWTVRSEFQLPVSVIGQTFSNTEVMHTAITAETKRSLVVQDVVNNPEIDQKFVEMFGIRSLLDFPLIVRGEVIGDLTFHYHSRPVPFNERQVEFARKLQISITLALENSQLNANVAARAAELEVANQDLEAFNYTVAHDLRNPLNTLSLSCQAIKILCGDQLNEECTSYVRNIYNSTLHMNQLIDALLTFSRMGHVEPHREKVFLSSLAQEVITMLQQTEPERQVDFRIADGIEANGDANLLRVVLDNLLGNAWKYSVRQEKAVIEFGVTGDRRVPTYFVRDNGAGFGKADAEKLFVPFQRLPGAEISKGFGIGLATVERIIQRHGGRIWAEGEPGKGAAFFFTLAAE